jgi:hypothetical protein
MGLGLPYGGREAGEGAVFGGKTAAGGRGGRAGPANALDFEATLLLTPMDEASMADPAAVLKPTEKAARAIRTVSAWGGYSSLY